MSQNLSRGRRLTCFFNPPRYMRLMEVVRGVATDEAVLHRMADFGERVLGKGIVYAKDTPNFIGNRIGVHAVMVTMHTALEMGLSVEEVDRLTGTIVGRPKSATFRTADLVGLDILSHVVQTSYERGEADEERETFQLPAILKTLIDDGRLGQKTRAGFYKKEASGEILSVDLKSGEYSPQKRVRFDGYRLAKDHHATAGQIRVLDGSDDKAGRFFHEILARTLIYAANRIPEISDDTINIDNAMKWGFGWQLGPFETWDAIGVADSVARMQTEGRLVPAWVTRMLASGRKQFYAIENGVRTYYDPLTETVRDMSTRERSLDLSLLKARGNVVQRDWSASLIDLGDGVLDLAFHSILQSTLNPIDGSIIDMLNAALDAVEAGHYRALVLGHQGPNFCAGANLALILGFCERGDWDGLEHTVDHLQKTTQRIRFLTAPVVAAPFQLTLGGGFELVAPAAHRVAAAETYIGAVEMGVGLIPGAGGNLRLLLNLMENAGGAGRLNVYPLIQKAFETIGFARVATSAEEARHLGYLLNSDTIVLNPDHLLREAKHKALELAEGYTPPAYRDDLKLPGRGARTAMAAVLKGFKAQGKISAHDETIARKLAYVLTGGDRAGLTKTVDEQYLLEIEREAFVSLAAEPLSQERMKYMLKKGKPLRN
ncbi:MAG: enoyl-CoA hydratase/isomerase family protein [gamma proteobacterium endosymbiont of Lamellibrachia anaximandri]|nr:enoyl-CoA hydratase/isomerase family protein [gamma proteobacterium endosymbiont of Lamellibrachia anaximandri]